MLKMPSPVHLQKWVETYKDELHPPIGNKVVWKDAEFVVMLVGGPNSRKDFHVDPGAAIRGPIRGRPTGSELRTRGFEIKL